MKNAYKYILGSVAIFGGSIIAAVILSKYLTIGVYTPLVPQNDLISIRGDELLRMAMSRESAATKQSPDSLFPIAVRVRWFVKDKSITEQAYTAATGKALTIGDLLL